MNRQEYLIYKILISLGMDFEYNFGELVVGAKVPDFYNTRDKKLIEYNGDYWHREARGSVEKEAWYKKFGWRCLTVKEEELEDLSSLSKRLLKYV